VPLDQQIAQLLPSEDVEPVVSVFLNLDKGHDEPSYRASLNLSNNLALAVKCDRTILRNVAELPRRAAFGFDLDGDVSSGFVGRDDVVMWDVAGKRGSDEPAAGQLCCDKILPRLPDKLVATSCCHCLLVRWRVGVGPSQAVDIYRLTFHE